MGQNMGFGLAHRREMKFGDIPAQVDACKLWVGIAERKDLSQRVYLIVAQSEAEVLERLPIMEVEVARVQELAQKGDHRVFLLR